MSDPVSALNGASFQGFAAVREMGPLGMITLRAKGLKSLDKAIKAVTGTKIPAQRRIEVNGDRACGWMSPDEYLLILPYAEVGEFFKQLHDEDDTRADLMEFLILTALRASEVRMAQWDEFNMDAGLWIVPAERMKAGKEHWVPLSSRCLEILRSLKANKPEGNNYVFPGRRDKPLGLSCFGQLLIKLGRDDITTHGFRSTFRDWAGETTAYPREVIEHALAHQLKDKVEAAYARGTLFEKRRRLMEDWAKFCATVRESSANVVPLQSSTAA